MWKLIFETEYFGEISIIMQTPRYRFLRVNNRVQQRKARAT